MSDFPVQDVERPRKSLSHAARGKLGGLKRTGAPAERIEEARRDVRAATAEDYITRLVNSAPPLTDAQRHRLAALLAPPTDRAA